MFCRGLKKTGVRVLAVIDTSYDSLPQQLREQIDDCYVVSSFHNYDEVYKAVAFFASKYGKPEWIESNNEAWLALDAKLRDDFNVKTGFDLATVSEFQSKSKMKEYYRKAGLPVADYILPETFEQANEFAAKHDYSAVLKPDHGVGASGTWHIRTEEDLKKYWKEAEELGVQMILEAYIDGDVITLDGLADKNGKIQFLGGMEYVSNCMDSVQNHDSIGTYYNFSITPEQKELAQRVVDSFGIKNRFFHGEYFRLNTDQPGVGSTGDLAALEMNFRPPGGFCPDLINYSYDADIYSLWAKVLMGESIEQYEAAPYSAGFVGRRTGVDYQYSTEMLMDMYKNELIDVEFLPPAFASAMGDVTIKARFTNPERRDQFFHDAFLRRTDEH